MTAKHNLQTTTEGIHQIHNWAYADAATRTGATGFIATDLYKIALQEDDFSLWMLTAVTPTWVQINGSSSVADFTDLADVPGSFAGYGGYAVAVNVGETALEFIPFPSSGYHTVEDAVTANVTNVVQLQHNSTGTPATGFGTGIAVQAETNTTPNTPIGGINWFWRDATHASRYAQVNLITQITGYQVAIARFAAPNTYGVAPNTIGRGAIDLQGRHISNTQVPAAPYSFIGPGKNHSISATANYGSVLGGYANTVQAQRAGIFSGTNNSIINSSVHATISGGLGNAIDGGTASFIGAGSYNEVNGDYGAAFGRNALGNLRASIVTSGGQFTSKGDAQGIIVHARREVTHSDANWYELFLDGTTGRLSVPTNAMWTFSVLISGATAGLAKTFSFKIEGAIENDGGITALLGTPTVTTIYDADDVSYDTRVTADDTNDALLIEVSDSDSSGDIVKWYGFVIINSLTAA